MTVGGAVILIAAAIVSILVAHAFCDFMGGKDD